ncbi:YobI family P-loop NTPase [Pedobacter yulinensis]|nr:P-loop NTPase fold protein [Pedobacter yulinensis]
MKLEDLGPTSNATKNETYEKSLYWALRNINVSNIALTGPYGSGKSSVIATFQSKYREFKYLNISLATFDKEFKEQDDWRQKVELSILQQLIYHVKNRELPDSRFKKISHTTKTEMAFVTLGLVLLGVCFFNIYKPDFIAKFSWWQCLSLAQKDLINYFSIGYFLFGISIIIYMFYRTLKSFRFSKLGLTSGSLELSDKEDRSIFNKHLDEIVYFFQVTPYDVIVIEDLDRFEDAEIFTKLREVNSLINNSRQVGRPVNFVYAVRDDMFKDTDRAKFFDIIIPVIPIINTSNSGDELNRKLDTVTLDKPIANSFFNTVTLYIQDMRLLINIINEFKIYLTQIGKGLDAEKMLSIIIYKNLYPDEFAKLHKQDGDVYKFINTKKGFIATHTEEIDLEIAAAENKIESLNEMKHQDIKELNSVYLTAILAELPNNSVLSLGNNDMSIAELLKDENFKKLTSLSSFSYRKPAGYYLGDDVLRISFAQIEQSLHADTYNARRKKLIAISENEIQTQRALIKAHNRKRSEIQGYRIQQVMNSFPEFALPAEFSNKPLLEFLIGGGYIDEHYPMYISYFIEGSLSQADMDFVQSLTRRKRLAFDLPLNNIATIVTNWLSIGNYGQVEILNITFFDWILKYDDREAEPRILFEQLAESEGPLYFTEDYLEKGTEIPQFLKKLAVHFPLFWDKLYDDIAYDDEILDRYLCLILEHVPADLIVNFDGSGKFTTYLQTMTHYVEIFKKVANKQNIKDTLAKLDIVFDHLQKGDTVVDIFEDIVDNDRYTLTPENIMIVFNAYPDLFKPATAEKWVLSQYTIIRESRAQGVFNYIKANINVYTENVLLKIDTNIQESELALIELLAYDDIDNAFKEQLIIRQQVIIKTITAVQSDYWDWLLKYERVEKTWGNILEYYMAAEAVTDILIIYLNSPAPGSLIKDAWNSFFKSADHKAAAAELEVRLLNEGQLRLDLYNLIAEQAHNKYDDLGLENLDDLKVIALIDTGTLDFTEDGLNAVNTHHPGLVLSFVLDNEEKYLELDWPLSPQQYVQLINYPGLTVERKLIYLKRLQAADLTDNLALALGKLLSVNTDRVPDFSLEFRVALFLKQPSVADTAELLQAIGRYLTPEALTEVISLLPSPYAELAVIQKKPMFFANGEPNNKLLPYLERYLTNIISSARLDEKNRWRVNFRKTK